MRKLLVILGIPIDDLNMEQALDRIDLFVEQGRATGKVHQIATINADFVVKSLRDPELRHLLQEADMATADGMPLVWGARWLGVPLEGRVTGADLVPALAERAAEKGYSVYFLGAAPGVAAQAAALLQTRYPELRVAGVCSPPYRSVLEMDLDLVEEIRRAKPDILFVAFGNPKQEKWIGMYGRELGVPVMMGVGGALDLIAGKTQRAPKWMQRIGFEWLYRLAQEPGRLWRRYVEDLLLFGAFFVRQWWNMRGGSPPDPAWPMGDIVEVEGTALMQIRGRFDSSRIEDFNDRIRPVLSETPFVILEMSEVTFLDSSAVGALVGLSKQVRDSGGRLWLAAVPSTVQRTLQLLRLDRFFSFCEDVEVGLALRKKRSHAQSAEVATVGKWQIYRVPRRLDASTAPSTAADCQQLLEEHPWLVLDFSGTDFLASAGLAVLARLNQEATSRNGEVRIAGCSPDVTRVIRMVRFDHIFQLHLDIDAALQATMVTASGGG